jgi:predicted NAD-dependent protein-ADP-ribosyltransferase YbiA (DUF1768 family)
MYKIEFNIIIIQFKMITRQYSSDEPTINFWANSKAPFHYLSNFALIPGGINYEGHLYPSSEHAFQSQKYIDTQRHRFSINGDLSTWDGLQLVYKLEEYDKKYKYWSKKNNIGIVAKMATNKKIGQKLELIRNENFESTDELWLDILKKKY